MGLRGLISRAVKAGMKALGDVPQDVTLRIVTAGAYNPSTGRTDNTNVDHTVKAIVTSNTTKDGEIKPNEKKVLFVTADLSVELGVVDLLIIGGVKYDIQTCDPDPAGATTTVIAVAS